MTLHAEGVRAAREEKNAWPIRDGAPEQLHPDSRTRCCLNTALGTISRCLSLRLRVMVHRVAFCTGTGWRLPAHMAGSVMLRSVGTKSPRDVLRLLNQSLVRPRLELSSTPGRCSWGRIAQTPCHIRHYDALSTHGADPPSSIKETGPLTFNPNQTNFWPTSQPQPRPDRVGQREARVGKVAINAENVAAANPRLGRKLPLERH